MTTASAKTAFPGLFPEPQEVSELGGATELSGDVRLVTSNVLPLQRKAMRGILTAAGVRVVANKKKFIIEVQVGDLVKPDPRKVPDVAREEYYELELRDSKVFIRSLGQSGALWGIQTLAAIYRLNPGGKMIPNLLVRDWPAMPNRGIFVENKWGPARMTLNDWYVTIDRLAALKLNCLGIGLYGCWGNCRYEGQPTEFLMVAVPDRPELQTLHKLRWYSPRRSQWCEESYLPVMFANNFLAEVALYGREKGVSVIPFVNSLGHNTMFPRLMPQVSAKAKDGTPTGVGYCLSAPETRQFLEGFYGSILTRYYPEGADFFHIELDEVWPDNADPADPHKVAEPWCQCEACRRHSKEENLQDYILWLAKMLLDKGVKKVVMWNDQLTRHMNVLDAKFVQRLKKEGVADRLILHWWWYSNESIDKSTHVALGQKLGLAGWVAPMTCYFNWVSYSAHRQNIALMMKMAQAEGAEGAVSYAVHDPAWLDHEALLANYAWNSNAVKSPEQELKKWAKGRYGSQSAAFLAAMAGLEQAASEYPALGRCFNYWYTYVKAGAPFPRAYPGEALEVLAALPKKADAVGQLTKAAAAAREAAAGFAAIAATEGMDQHDLAAVKSLTGEAARLEGVAGAFAALLPIWQQAQTGKVGKPCVATCQEARELLLGAMTRMEANKPEYTVPASLQALSVLLEFLDQLKADLTAVASGKRKAKDIRWQVGHK